jgi:hypothetical protein
MGKSKKLLKYNNIFNISKYNGIGLKYWEKAFIKGNIKEYTPFSNPMNNLSMFAADIYATAERKSLEEQRSPLDFNIEEYKRIYLKNRTDRVFRNFTDTYTDKIKSAMTDYMSSSKTPTLRNERILYNRLSLRSWDELSREERIEYFNTLDPQATAPYINLKTKRVVKNFYGLRSEIINNPLEYDYFGGYSHDLGNRINRIAATELSYGFNMGRINNSLNKGARHYAYNVTGLETCMLCTSLRGSLVILDRQIINNFSITFNRLNTRLPYTLPPNTRRKYFVPPVHPYCDCNLIALDEKKLDQAKALLTPLAYTEYLSQISTGTTVQTKTTNATTLSLATTVSAYALHSTLKLLQIRKDLSTEYEEAKKKGKLILYLAVGSVMSLAAGYATFLLAKPKIKEKIKRAAIDLAAKVVSNKIEDKMNDVVFKILTDDAVEKDMPKTETETEELEKEEELQIEKAEKDFIYAQSNFFQTVFGKSIAQGLTMAKSNKRGLRQVLLAREVNRLLKEIKKYTIDLDNPYLKQDVVEYLKELDAKETIVNKVLSEIEKYQQDLLQTIVQLQNLETPVDYKFKYKNYVFTRESAIGNLQNQLSYSRNLAHDKANNMRTLVEVGRAGFRLESEFREVLSNGGGLTDLGNMLASVYRAKQIELQSSLE